MERQLSWLGILCVCTGSCALPLKAVSCGTELNIVQEDIPEGIPLEMCYLGWQESLELLTMLVEPEIPA